MGRNNKETNSNGKKINWEIQKIIGLRFRFSKVDKLNNLPSFPYKQAITMKLEGGRVEG